MKSNVTELQVCKEFMLFSGELKLVFRGQTSLPKSKEKCSKHMGILAGAPVGGWEVPGIAKNYKSNNMFILK